jgi:hypothetical protein
VTCITLKVASWNHHAPRLYNLAEGTVNRVQYGRVAGMTDHMNVLRYAVGVCAAGYQPGTIERGLLEQFAADGKG